MANTTASFPILHSKVIQLDLVSFILKSLLASTIRILKLFNTNACACICISLLHTVVHKKKVQQSVALNTFTHSSTATT